MYGIGSTGRKIEKYTLISLMNFKEFLHFYC